MFGNVRARVINGEAWFVGKDVAQALGYANTKDALAKHVFDDYKRVFTNKIIAQMASQRKGGETPPLEMRMTPQIVRGQKKRGDTLPPICNVYLRRGNILNRRRSHAVQDGLLGGLCHSLRIILNVNE